MIATKQQMIQALEILMAPHQAIIKEKGYNLETVKSALAVRTYQEAILNFKYKR